MPGITHIHGIKMGISSIGNKHKVVANQQKIGGALKAHSHLCEPEDINPSSEYGSNLNRLKQSLKTMNINAKPPSVKRTSKYINF